MAIKEKNKTLEFAFILDKDGEKISYDITYDSSDKLYPITIEHGEDGRCGYPLELFVEVVAFLREKGVMGPVMRDSSRKTPIPIPVIQSKEVKSSDVNIQGPVLIRDSNVDPLTSFDITDTGTSKVASGQLTGPVISEGDTTKEIIKRPVIRSRISEGDPLSAEKEASVLREEIAKGNKKSFKRDHIAE